MFPSACVRRCGAAGPDMQAGACWRSTYGGQTGRLCSFKGSRYLHRRVHKVVHVKAAWQRASPAVPNAEAAAGRVTRPDGAADWRGHTRGARPRMHVGALKGRYPAALAPRGRGVCSQGHARLERQHKQGTAHVLLCIWRAPCTCSNAWALERRRPSDCCCSYPCPMGSIRGPHAH